MSTQTVKQFVLNSYQLVSASNPNVPLHGSDMAQGIQFLNELLCSYSGTGLLITVANKITFQVQIGQRFITFADPSFLPAADVQQGRLANLQNAWLELDGVTYPLVDESRNVFFASYKFEPQEGLPRFCIITNNNDYTTMQIYPSPSQIYNLWVYGKFQLSTLTENMTMGILPSYFTRFLRLALAKDLAFYKGRSAAWTQDLAQELKDAKEDMQSVSSVNLSIQTDHDSYLNGSWRVRAGV